MKKMKFSRFVTCALLAAHCLNLTGNSSCCHQDQSDQRFYADVDYLFWQAEASETYYAIKTSGTFGSQGFLNIDRFDIENLCFKGNSGVRAKVGYFFCNDWDTRLAYTHFNSCAFGSVAQPDGILATAIFQLLNDFIASEARSSWTAKLNVIDWEIGNTQNFGEDFYIRPHIGIKWAQLKQLQTIEYFEIAQISQALVARTNNYSGTGPGIGVDTQWCFWNNLSLIGNISGALLYGKFNIHSDYTITTEPPFTPETETFTPTVASCNKNLVSMAQAFLGLNWEASWDCAAIDIGIGYEAQYWWSQWQSIPTVVGIIATTPGYGDFTTHGLTASLGIRF